MLSAGMLTDFASATIVLRRGLLSMSPPPARAATVSSLMMRVKTLPRLASAAPFLCLIVCHLEWPDMVRNSSNYRKNGPGMVSHGRTAANGCAGSGSLPLSRCVLVLAQEFKSPGGKGFSCSLPRDRAPYLLNS